MRALTASLLDEAEAREHGLRARVMLLNASWRVGLSPEEIGPLAVEARQIAARQGDARSRVDVETALMPAYWLTGQLAEAAEIGAEAVRLADAAGDVMFRALIRADLGHIYTASGRLDDALRVRRALDIGIDDRTSAWSGRASPSRSGRAHAAAGRRSRWGGWRSAFPISTSRTAGRAS